MLFDEKKKIVSVGAFSVIFSWCSNIFENAIKVAALLNIFQPCVSKDGSRHGNNSITYTKKSIAHQSFLFLVKLLELSIFSAKTYYAKFITL